MASTMMHKLRLMYRRLTQQLRRMYATTWVQVYGVVIKLQTWLRRCASWCQWIVLVVLVAASFIAAPYIEPKVLSMGDTSHIGALQQFLASVGGSLIGATAIGFSIIVFAMQINVERMPHGLFRRLSSDRKLLVMFICTFGFAAMVAVLSLTVDQAGVARTLLLSAWGATTVLLLLLASYRRALDLISPYEQLRIVQRTAETDLRRWARRSKRLEPLFLGASQGNVEDDGKVVVDSSRMAFFRVHPHWTAAATECIAYAMAFARGFAERSDHEVARAALNTVVAINLSYVRAKGKTFFSVNGLIDNPYATDGFINSTLEHLRQYSLSGLSRDDERQIDESFRAMAGLALAYMTIDYAVSTRPSHLDASCV